jgi:hypothetical protein
VATQASTSGPWADPSAPGYAAGPWGWVRSHRLYSASVAAIVAATLVGAQWAGQPSGHVGPTSSPSPAAVTASE